MTPLAQQHILSVDQFDRDILTDLYRVADLLQPIAASEERCIALEGATLANLFFEPSTRTRTSFASAFHQLGGKVVETTDEAYSSLVKGESLTDTARVLSGMADVVVMRHHVSGSVQDYATTSKVPVINGGDGPGEHPTQALLDAYTMAHELKRSDYNLDGVNVALIGDLKHGRTVHSLAKLLSIYDDVTFTLISPDALRMPETVREVIEQHGHNYTESPRLRDGLAHADVVYVTRIQEERFDDPREAQRYRGRLALDRAKYERFAPHQPPILHPLPRDSRSEPMELSRDLEELESFAAFRQAHNGVPVRMALFAAVLGIESGFLTFMTRPSYAEVQDRWRSNDKVNERPARAKS